MAAVPPIRAFTTWETIERRLASSRRLEELAIGDADDGGHTPHQQIVTLEELLPHLRPGGVFICEDVHGMHHDFAAYVCGIVGRLNEIDSREGGELAATPSPLQRDVYSVHFYPYVVVIERTAARPAEFVAPKHGTEWQPFPV